MNKKPLTSLFTNIANAIREKKETVEPIKALDFADEILSIEGGGDFYEGAFEFFGAETKEEKMVVLNKITYMLLRNGYDDLAEEIIEYREDNELWPTEEETIILGVIGEPAESTLLSRYDGAESYLINPQSRVDGNHVLWEWDDTKWPFNKIEQYVDDEDNVFVTIPKMWVKLVKDGNTIKERYISNVKVDEDWELAECFIDQDTLQELPYYYQSVYEGAQEGARMVSKSGKTVLVDQTLAVFRDFATNYNRLDTYQYHLFDMHIKFILETLYLIVFANTNSDELFPQGGSGSVQQTGVMDGMEHHTGYRTNLTNYPMKFLGIENYFSNTYTQVDGVKISGRAVYVCDNPRLYNSASNMDDYYLIGSTPTSSEWIKALGTTQGLFSIPITGGGVDNKWYSDYLSQGSSGPYTLYFGRYWSSNSDAGLFYWRGGSALGNSYSYLGARLVKKPLP